MNKNSENIFEAALQLPVTMRAELAATLIDSLDTVSDEAPQTAWHQETIARVRTLEAHEVSTIPWQEVRKKILGNGE